jgi:short-subunit dehydrogenase
MGQGRMTAYCTSKFGVRGFTESLRAELLAAGHPVQVSVVHPGGVRTNIATAAFEHARAQGRQVTAADEARHRRYNEKLLRMPPEQAARIIVDGVEAGRPRILVGNDAKVLDLLVRLVPRLYPVLLARAERRLSAGA